MARFVAKLLLVAVTLLCLASMGGAMLYAFPVLVPLHWLASRSSGPAAVGGWALLAGLSLFQGAWMLTYVATGSPLPSMTVGAVALVATVTLFLRRSAPPASA